jgi:hypothetical protein
MFPSTFVQHHTQGLIRSPSSILISSTALEPSAETQTLRSLLISLKTPLTSSAVRDAVNLLVLSEQSAGVDPDQSVLKKVVIDKLVVSLYAEALDTYLAEASNVEAEAEWWADIERSRQNVAWYLLQSMFNLFLSFSVQHFLCAPSIHSCDSTISRRRRCVCFQCLYSSHEYLGAYSTRTVVDG